MTKKNQVLQLGVLLFASLHMSQAPAAQPSWAEPRLPQPGAAPSYRVDPFWPEELPNKWIMGQVGGLAVDAQDHVWVLQRPRSASVDELWAGAKPPQAACCVLTPAVLEFDGRGRVLQAWGGPGFVADWPEKEHGIWVDSRRNVWIGGSAPGDRHILKFDATGKKLLQIGQPSKAPKNNQDTALLGSPADIQIDEAANEIYVADGYVNNRIVVYDSQTGKFKRGWGAYGITLSKVANAVTGDGESLARPDPNARQFGNPVHCVRVARDGLVYVCDRSNNRIQIFDKQGMFQRQFVVQPETLGLGSVWSVSFSKDPQQTHLLVADGTNNVVWVLRRSDGTQLSSFGHRGRNAGQFHWVHQAASDSRGNFYTGEVDSAKRVQKFVLE